MHRLQQRMRRRQTEIEDPEETAPDPEVEDVPAPIKPKKRTPAPKAVSLKRPKPVNITDDMTAADIMPEVQPCSISHLTHHRGSSYDVVRSYAEDIVQLVHNNNVRPNQTRMPSELAKLTSEQGMFELIKLMSQTPHDTLTMGAESRCIIRQDVKIVTREWESRFMREPQGTERPCVKSFNGTCFARLLMSNNLVSKTFKMVEFYDQQKYEMLEEHKFQWPSGPPNLCILCMHSDICAKFIRNRSSHHDLADGLSCSSIGNIIDQEGEYRLEDTMVNTPGRNEGLVVPVAHFCPEDFTVSSVRGIRRLSLNLPYPDTRLNFCSASFVSA